MFSLPALVSSPDPQLVRSGNETIPAHVTDSSVRLLVVDIIRLQSAFSAIMSLI